MKRLAKHLCSSPKIFHGHLDCATSWEVATDYVDHNGVSRGAVRSAASSYTAMLMVAGSRPILVIARE